MSRHDYDLEQIVGYLKDEGISVEVVRWQQFLDIKKKHFEFDTTTYEFMENIRELINKAKNMSVYIYKDPIYLGLTTKLYFMKTAATLKV